MPSSRPTPPVDPTMLGAEARILEGIVTTLNADGAPHISPMGPIVDEAMNWLWLRPFRDTTTFKNLERSPCGVFHLTDDIELIAHAALGEVTPPPKVVSAEIVNGVILIDACRWYAFEVEWIDASMPRTDILARVVDRGALRDFVGFNRAKNAVLEAAILATRVHLIDAGEIRGEFERLGTIVKKTGAAPEHRAMQFLQQHVERAINQ